VVYMCALCVASSSVVPSSRSSSVVVLEAECYITSTSTTVPGTQYTVQVPGR